jgi:thiamine pyrophosphate-dependent acetolactate synthase large subunit-like protein
LDCSLGVDACRVETADEIEDAVAAAGRSGRPARIDVLIDRPLGPDRR